MLNMKFGHLGVTPRVADFFVLLASLTQESVKDVLGLGWRVLIVADFILDFFECIRLVRCSVFLLGKGFFTKFARF